MIEESPLVSIIIPCFNQGKFLAQTIESALSQTYSHIEIIVVNDGSNDNSAEVAARYATVKYLFQENRGVAEARNFGLSESRGAYLKFLDADDRLTRDAIAAHLRCFAAHPHIGFVVGDIEWIDEINRHLGKGSWPFREADHYEELLKVNHVSNTVAAMFKREVLEKAGVFNAYFSPAEDYEMLVRAARTFPSVHHSDVVAEYRRHTSNTSRKGALMLKATRRVMIAERPHVKGAPRLETALRHGERHWRDFFGAVTIKEIFARLREGELVQAGEAASVFLSLVRERIFVIPWKYRRRGMVAAGRRLQRGRKWIFSRIVRNSAPARET